MTKSLAVLIACLLIGPAFAAAPVPPASETSVAPAPVAQPDSLQMEQELQALPWKQFRTVIESIPKMKADVDAYGVMGWSFVEANYQTHPWKKNIDRLDASQKQQLITLIQTAKGSGCQEGTLQRN